METHNINWDVLLNRIIRENSFIQRKASWIASCGDYFFKIPKISRCVEDDSVNPTATEIAKKEYEQTIFLNQLDSTVLRPVALVDACMIMPNLKGNNLIDESKIVPPYTFQTALEEGLSLGARLHRYKSCLFEEIPIYRYENDPFFPATNHALREMKSHPRSIIVYGFEIRNFKRDGSGGCLKFFDPHDIAIGIPEEDFSRYLLSVLMINWGKNIRCIVWDKFNLDSLIKIYEENRERALNRQLLSYTLSLNIAMRKDHARKKIMMMSPLKRFIAATYLKVFFKQVEFWRIKHGI